MNITIHNWLSAAWRSQVTVSENYHNGSFLYSAFPLRKQAEARVSGVRPTHDADYLFCKKEYDQYKYILNWLLYNYTELGPTDIVGDLVGEGEEYAHLCNEIYNKFGVELSFVLDLTFEELAEVIYKSMKEL